LLEAAILLFIPGTLKCLEKPFALWRASISNMAISVGSKTCKIDDDDDDHKAKMEEDMSLDEFVREASLVYRSVVQNDRLVRARDHRVKVTPYRFFVDIPYPTSIRLANLKYMSKKRDKAHWRVRSSLSKAFNRLYTNYKGYPGAVLRALLVLLTIVAIRLFNMRRRAYDNADLKVTYVLLSCTAALECISAITMARCRMMSEPPWPDQVAQCNLLRFVAHGKRHRKLRWLASLLGCDGYLDRLWCTGYINRFWCTGCLDRLWCASPPRSRPPPPCPDGITELIHDHISSQWRDHINGDAVAYRRFSDSRGQCTLDRELCNWNKHLMSSLWRPFDESVVIWHLATDFCVFNHVDDGSKENRRCREISNYMVYLLLVNPEMLMPGARRQIFWVAYDQVRKIFKDDKPPEDADELARKIIQEEKKNEGFTGSGLLQEAWSLAQELTEVIGKEDKVKMWRVIRGVWVEMLCFSAGRCSGHLHAKALGTGGEFLSYVWVLREFMGMENLAHTVQRPPHLLTDLALPERAEGYWYTGEIAIESEHDDDMM
jgi:hypothetical protein